MTDNPADNSAPQPRPFVPPPMIPAKEGETPPPPASGSSPAPSRDAVVRPSGASPFKPAESSDVPELAAIEELKTLTVEQTNAELRERARKKRFRISVILFVLTFISTTLVGADFWPAEILLKNSWDDTRAEVLLKLEYKWPSAVGVNPSISDRFWQTVGYGCMYSCPLMLILFCHEMGHYLQAVRYRVPASPPFFIPLPLPPLGTMGAVILQGAGAPDRRRLFDIAVSGPLAGLAVTIPVLWYGIAQSEYVPAHLVNSDFALGRPLMVQWMIDAILGPAPPGMELEWHGYAKAGWVGVFVTAMNLLPVGQLDGGHIMYSLIRKKAHLVAWGVVLTGAAAMIWAEMYSYVLLLILLTLTGPRHPPTADDRESPGRGRIIIGWLTLAFLLIGFTPQPIAVGEPRPAPPNILAPLPDELELQMLRQFRQMRQLNEIE